MSQEINSIIQRVIPILINSCDIERGNILTDASTTKTTPKRGDLWISKSDIHNKRQFEKNILLLIEAKDEATKPLKFDEIYSSDFELLPEFKNDFDTNLENYSSKGKNEYIGKYKNNKWLDALIQGKYKSEKQGLEFFAVSNTINIVFYHTKTLKPILVEKNGEIIPLNFWIKLDFLLEISEAISKDNNIIKIDKIETVIDNPSEYDFQKFLKKIHNQNVFRFNDELIIDSLLTFVFFKFLEEKMASNNEKTPINGVLWSNFTKNAKKGKEGKQIIENIYQQLEMLKDPSSEYKDIYKEFTPILKIPNDLRTKDENFPVIFSIWKEFSKYNFHGCEFDIYGSIYEEFASPKQKEKLGQFYTRRHISKILADLVLRDIKDVDDGFKVCDPACGTGGLLTECYNVLKEKIKDKYYEIPDKKNTLLSERVFYGYDIVNANVEKAKLNMFFAGDGHTNITKKDSIKKLPKIILEDDSEGFDVIVANPPYGNGSSWYKDYVTWKNTKRHELVFMERMIKALKYGGRFGFVIPDGVLENPKWEDFRTRLLEQVKIESIISVPVYSFAPYCMQKTYLIIGNRRSYNQIRRLTSDPDFEQEAFDKVNIKKISLNDIKEQIWMYILDFDGYANSNKRYPTDLSIIGDDDKIQFLHNDLFELKDKYLVGQDGTGTIVKINQIDLDGSKMGEYTNKGFMLKRASYFELNKAIDSKRWYILLPEYYLRPYEPKHISINDFKKEKKKIEKELKILVKSLK